jgi:uncharacterized protein (DUF2147 family)
MNAVQLIALCVSLLLATVIRADEPDAVHGQWASDGSIIEITEVDGTLSAHVLSIRDAVYGPNEQGPVGEIRRDDNNPDVALRQRTIIGIDLLSEYAFDDGKWQGRIYDPESGKTFTSHMKRGRNGQLEMRGYIGVPMLGRTVIFDPVASCKPHIVEMLARIAGNASCSAVAGTPAG